jgi:hypothetical protein
MLRFKLAMGGWVHDPRARAILILGVLLLAALAGGAPTDRGGGG